MNTPSGGDVGHGTPRPLWRRACLWADTHGEWLFVLLAAIVSLGATRQGPTAAPDAYITGTFGVTISVIALCTVWVMLRRGREPRGRRLWVAWVGVPVAILLVVLPDLVAGRLDDERSGTLAVLLMLSLLLFVAVLIGMAVAACVLLPLGWIIRTIVLTLAGRSNEAPLIVLAALPLIVVAFAVTGAMALDLSPVQHASPVPSTDILANLGPVGFAGIARAFGAHNGVRIVDPAALAWFRVLTIVLGLYLIGILAVALSEGPKNSAESAAK